jgi:acetyl-CoA carboxylase biotin carboxyl carrier protein
MSKQQHPIDPELVRAVAELVAETGMTEIEVEKGDLKIRVSRQQPMMSAPVAPYAPNMPMGGQIGAYMSPQQAPAATPDTTAATAPAKTNANVTSPMVGTAYRAPEPGAKPFIDVGSKVKEGQTLLIIEAMKTMNAIPAPKAGTVTAILFDDAQPVEYGEPLMVIE